MQIEEKYKKDYALALNKIKDVRRQFVRELSKISWIRVIPSQANYLLIEITGGISAKELTKILLLEYNILIKDLSNKILKEGKQFIRIAVRNSRENEILVNALKKIGTGYKNTSI